MLTVQQITKTLEEDYSLKMVAQAYTEVSAVKLQNIRKGIEKNRLFFEEITKIFHRVRFVAFKKNIKVQSTRRDTVNILLTSNHRFYGKIEDQLIKFFITNTSKSLADRVVIGKSGVDFLIGMHYFHPYQQFTLQEDIPNTIELKSIAGIINKYAKVVVYYNKFQSVMVQSPVAFDITSSIAQPKGEEGPIPASLTVPLSTTNQPVQNLVQKPNTQPTKKKEDKIFGIDIHEHSFDYIFEPEIEKMVQFFENHIATLILEQTFLESELARTASRLISMDEAQNNADQLIKQQKGVLFQAKNAEKNVRLLETIANLIRANQAYYSQKKGFYA